MKLSEELQARGFVNQHTGESLAEVLDGEKRIVYHGIDPTADSAHVGNFVAWLLLHHLVKHGHKVIFLVGGGTGMIGDPKPDAERVLQTPEQIEVNVNKIKIQAERLVGQGSEVVFVNNADWLLKEGLISFLRDIGKYFTVNELIKKEAIANRMEGEVGISYTEFAYPLLQAYDYLTLNRDYGCDLQVGGSDQWGNIVAGVELIRRKEKKVAHALTVPLIIDKATGKKFGKSEGNAVWLDAEKTSPYQFYQFWFNASDESVVDYLKVFTILSLEEIVEIENTFRANPGSRSAQKKLAFEVTKFVHGEEDAISVAKASEALFGEVSFSDLSESEVEMLKTNAPHTEIQNGCSLIDVLVQSGLASSKREARTFIESGAVQVNGEKVEDLERLLDSEFDGINALIKRGKKQYSVITLV